MEVKTPRVHRHTHTRHSVNLGHVKRAGSLNQAQHQRTRRQVRSNSVFVNDHANNPYPYGLTPSPSPLGGSPRHSRKHSHTRCDRCEWGHSRTNSLRRPSISISNSAASSPTPNRSRKQSSASISMSLHNSYPGLVPPSPTRHSRSSSVYINELMLHPTMAGLQTRSNSIASQRSLARLDDVSSLSGKHRQIVVFIITATFLFLVFLSVTAVLVTLTHRSEIQVGDNQTKTIYTFAP